MRHLPIFQIMAIAVLLIGVVAIQKILLSPIQNQISPPENQSIDKKSVCLTYAATRNHTAPSLSEFLTQARSQLADLQWNQTSALASVWAFATPDRISWGPEDCFVRAYVSHRAPPLMVDSASYPFSLTAEYTSGNLGWGQNAMVGPSSNDVRVAVMRLQEIVSLDSHMKQFPHTSIERDHFVIESGQVSKFGTFNVQRGTKEIHVKPWYKFYVRRCYNTSKYGENDEECMGGWMVYQNDTKPEEILFSYNIYEPYVENLTFPEIVDAKARILSKIDEMNRKKNGSCQSTLTSAYTELVMDNASKQKLVLTLPNQQNCPCYFVFEYEKRGQQMLFSNMTTAIMTSSRSCRRH